MRAIHPYIPYHCSLLKRFYVGSVYVGFGIVTALRKRAMLWNVSVLYIKDNLYINKVLPIGGSCISGGCAKIWTMTMWVLLYCRFGPDENHFSLELCMLLSYRLHKVVYSIELRACLNGASLNINSSVIMIPPIVRTPTIIMTHESCFRLIMDIPIVWSHILFTMLIINTELEHNRIMISATFLY